LSGVKQLALIVLYSHCLYAIFATGKLNWRTFPMTQYPIHSLEEQTHLQIQALKHRWQNKLKFDPLKKKDVSDITKIIDNLEQIEKGLNTLKSR